MAFETTFVRAAFACTHTCSVRLVIIHCQTPT